MTSFVFYASSEDSIEILRDVVARHSLKPAWVAYDPVEKPGAEEFDGVSPELLQRLARYPKVVLTGPFSTRPLEYERIRAGEMGAGRFRFSLDASGPALVFELGWFGKGNQSHPGHIATASHLTHPDWFLDADGALHPASRELDEAVDAIIATIKSRLVPFTRRGVESWVTAPLREVLESSWIEAEAFAPKRSEPMIWISGFGKSPALTRPPRPRSRVPAKPPPSFSECTRSGIVEAYGGADEATSIVGDEILSVPSAFLCLAPLSFPTTSTAIFELKGPNRAQQQLLARGGRPDPNMHLFAKLAGDRFLFVGRAWLTDFAGSSIRFSLKEPLPPAIHERLTEPPWRIEVSHRLQTLRAGETDAFDRLVAELDMADPSHLRMEIHGDALTLFVHAGRAVIERSGAFGRDPSDVATTDTSGFACECDFAPAVSEAPTISLERARAEARTFFREGAPSSSLEWTRAG